MIRAVVDTNIIVSGLLFGGIPLKIIESSLVQNFSMVTSPYLIEETERVLSHKKFSLSNDEIISLVSPLWDNVEIIIPKTKVDIIKNCPADNRVLECALDGECDYIVTGDKRDLLKLIRFRNIKMITARDFLEKLC